MVLGVFGDGTTLIVDDEGSLIRVSASELEAKTIKVDIRFDFDEKKWEDVEAMPE